jgi:poly(ADP-ribose) glycohydrolase ARH3
MKRSIYYSEEKALGLMFGMVLGDAVGIVFNDTAIDELPILDLEYLRQHPPKYYTDDTQMAISVLEEMIENGLIDQVSLQNRLINRFSPWREYGGGMLDVIEKWRCGESISSAATSLYNGTGSFGDGAAVRSAPISLFFKENEMIDLFEQVTRIALLTHTHPYGIAGAQLYASAVLFALNDVSESEWIPRIFKLPFESAFKIKLGQIVVCLENNASVYESVKHIGNGAEAIEAVPAALYAALRHSDSIVDAILFAVSMGGDCDTIGAMTGALIGSRLGIQNIPPDLLNTMENDKEGVDFIKTLVKNSGIKIRRGEDLNLR